MDMNMIEYSPDEYDLKAIQLSAIHTGMNEAYVITKIKEMCKRNEFRFLTYHMDFLFPHPKRKLLIEKQLYK